mgnify:FL=1
MTQESWGGSFVKDGERNHFVDGPGAATVSKWRRDYQREFAERTDRCLDE